MRIYQSGGTPVELSPKMRSLSDKYGLYDKVLEWMRHRLLSWPYISRSTTNRYRDVIKERGFPKSVMLDSGAFTAWTKGISLNLDEYSDFAQENLDLFDFIVSIDVLPSFKGDRSAHRLTREFEVSAEKSWKNVEYLLSTGLTKKNLVPVFHQGESINHLKFLSEQGFFLIGISPGNDRSAGDKFSWLRECRKVVSVDGLGRPSQRCHGFAVTDFSLMKSFPWFSVDSATWAISSGHGNVLVPSKGFTDFSNPTTLSVSRRKGTENYTGLKEYFESHLGMEMEDIENHAQARCITQLYAMEKFTKWLNKEMPFINNTKTSRLGVDLS